MIRVQTIDAHAAGEPLRLIVDGFPSPRGKTMLEKREWVKRHADDLRRARSRIGVGGKVAKLPRSRLLARQLPDSSSSVHHDPNGDKISSMMNFPLVRPGLANPL